jgi:hypothetical protein
MITQGLALTFNEEILRGIHQPNHVYRIALYVADADLGPFTKQYTPNGEVNGLGYQAGGKALVGYRTGLDLATASGWLTFDNPVWTPASIRARGALIYNYSANNRAIGVLDLGQDYVSTNGPFSIMLPDPNVEPMIRIGGS